LSIKVSNDFGDQIAIVTGGTRGLGRIIAMRLAAVGATVVTCGRTPPDSVDDGIHFYQVDIRDADAANDFVDQVAKEHGRVDLLVNNAGGSPTVSAAQASPRLSEAVVRLNLLAPLFLSQAVWRHMQPEGAGSIINIASVSGTRPSPGTAAYGAAKAGLINLSRTLAQEWGGDGIRVNAIVAGLMATENTEDTYGDSAAQRRIADSIPLKRLGTGDDIAKAVMWLASDAASWVSGAVLNIDGGGERPVFLELLEGQ